jgi:hypothetical protein
VSILEDFRTWLWIMKNKYNPHMSEYFFNRVGSNLPEQTFIKAEDTLITGTVGIQSGL